MIDLWLHLVLRRNFPLAIRKILMTSSVLTTAKITLAV